MFTQAADLVVQPQPDLWAVRSSLDWVGADGFKITVPAGFITDLASIPRVLRNVLDVDGRSRDPAILHDWLYASGKTTRAFADDQLRRALIEYGESPTAARVYWLGVRVGGGGAWDGHRKTGITVKSFDTVGHYINWKYAKGLI